MTGKLIVGQHLGKYLILSEIGRGGMGVVYLAEDEGLNRQVALKILPTTLMSDEAFVMQFRKEAKVIAAIAHPNIVHIHSFDIVDNIPVIEMEYIEGGSLARKLQSDYVSLHDIVHYAHGVSCALGFCHSMNAIHRDIKPSNILIDKFNQAKLADFGIAKAILDHEHSSMIATWSGAFQGTPLYAPPEAWDGQSATRAWDIYGLGAVMYQGLTGGMPYEANTPLELVKKISNTQIPPVKSANTAVSNELASLVDEMLCSEPAKRVSNAELVRDRLEDTPEYRLRIDTVTVPRGGVLPERSRSRSTSIKRRPRTFRTWRVYSVACLAAIVALALMVWHELPKNSGVGSVQNGTEKNEKSGSVDPQKQSRIATLSVKDFLAIPKGLSGGHSVVLSARTQFGATRESESWLVLQTETGLPSRIVIADPASVAVLDLASSKVPDEYAAIGSWAAYADKDGTVLRYGSVHGTLDWKSSPVRCVGELSYVSEQDGSVREGIVSADEPEPATTDTSFICELENSEFLQPLLYRELFPRKMALAGTVEELLPAFSRGASLDSIKVSNELAFTLDGALDDPIWKAAFTDQTASAQLMNGVPDTLRPWLAMACTAKSIVLGLKCNYTPRNDKWALDIRILSTYTIPLSVAPILHVVYSQQGGATLESFGPGEQNLAAGQAKSVFRSVDGDWQMEVEIPFATFGSQSTGPAQGERWRMNAVLSSEDSRGSKGAICRWGFPDEKAIQHGAILRFID